MKRILICLLALLLTLPALAETADSAEVADAPRLEIHQMNLGFADGYFIRLGDVEIMIDGGEAVPDAPEGIAFNYLGDVGCTKLDAYIVTHWHLDHCFNLNNVLAWFGTDDTVVYGASSEVHEDYAPLANGSYTQMRPGQIIEIGGLKITCVGPKSLENDGNRNQDSLNFVIEYAGRKVLFTGDFAASGNINAEYKDVCSNVDVLKFPHHGMQPFEIGPMACRTTSPEYVMVPGVVSKFKIWDFFDDNGVKFSQSNVYTVGDGHFVLLIDPDGTLQFVTNINPADYAK